MRVSLNTIKQYTNVDLPVDELVAKINRQLGGVEEVIDLGAKYKDALIVKVVESNDHPNADRLHVTKIDDGRVIQDVPRDENGYVQVVCGAPNVHADMFAVWLPPKSTVPASFDDDEPFVLDARELRGVVSQGMLAAADELAIGSDHAGILEVNSDEWKPNDIEVKAGANFAEVYGLNDTIIDIENKMFTHRPDLFGQLGVAREIAGILGHKFTSPHWYMDTPEFSEAAGLDLDVVNDATEKVPRFMAVAMKNVIIKPSPLWLQCELVRLGSKPINNVVDVTNYVMLLTAQPVHAYDYDKLRGHKLGARLARDGETITLLNHKTYELDNSDIVIVDGEGPVGLAGIMGGGESEVSNETKNIVLEVATFDMYTLRKTSMRHGIFTDALTRFNKGQSPLQNNRIVNLLMMSIKDVASESEQASTVFDVRSDDFGAEAQETVSLDETFINTRLGLSLSRDEIQTLLENVEFNVRTDSDMIIAKPFWRTDIELPEDVVEEVGRLYGYEKLPRELPKRSITPPAMNTNLERKQRIRENLARAGANEVVTYSFVHENVMKKAGQNPEHAFRLSNALSPDLQYYRLSLMPSLLDKVHTNVKAGYGTLALFELGKAHFVGEMDEHDPDVPNESSQVALIVASTKKERSGAAYFAARRYAEQIVDWQSLTGVPLAEFTVSNDAWGAQLVAPYEPSRSMVIVRDDQIWGVVGEFKQSVQQAFKLPSYAAGFELHLDVVTHGNRAYVPLSRFPSVTQDVSLKIATDITFDEVFRSARHVVDALDTDEFVTQLTPLSIYQGEGESERTITLRLNIASRDRTLTDADVTPIIDAIAQNYA